MSTKTGVLTRSIAIDAMSHILQRHQHADIALDKLFKARPELRPIDKAFVFEMVYGSLRWLSKMDWIMSHMVNRPFHSLDPRVANALRIGTYQIYYMDRVPDRAAVSETVEALKTVGASQAASFANAILRRVARKSEYFPKPDKEKEQTAYLSMHHAHAPWMVDRWMNQIPLERLEHVLSSHNKAPLKNLRVMKKNPLPEGENLANYLLRTQGIKSEWRPLKSSLRVEEFPAFGQCSAFASGSYIVQDESAQLAASLVQLKPGSKVLDACASPGGKTMAIWDEAPADVEFYLSDSSKKRLPVLRENLERMSTQTAQSLQKGQNEQNHGAGSAPFQWKLEHGDAVSAFGDTVFDTIVLDAPCTAMGVIARHPEIKWHRVAHDITQCAEEQARLLEGLAPRVKVGGELVYMVCSFELEETTEQIAKFLHRHPEFIAVDLSFRIHDYYRKYVTKNGCLTIWSGNQDEIDGFFACVLQKQK